MASFRWFLFCLCRAAYLREYSSDPKGFREVGGSVSVSSSWKSCRAEITCAEVSQDGGGGRSGLGGSGSLAVLSCCLGSSARSGWRRQGGRCVFWERAAPTNLIPRRSGRRTRTGRLERYGEMRKRER